LIREVCRYYPNALAERYGWENAAKQEEKNEDAMTESEAAELLKQIAVSRKCYMKGEEPDLSRAAALLIDDFRSGRLGRMTLERR
jgi:ribosome biogenesis GTPase A